MLGLLIVPLTVLYIFIISELIILIKDINKRIKNAKYSPNMLKKLKMGMIACMTCILVLLIILLINYLSFFKII